MTPALRFAPALPYWHDGKVIYTGPAMLAAVTDPDGALVGCHITWIDPDNPGKKVRIEHEGEILPAKKLRGTMRRGAIKLIDPPDASRLVIGEGIETVLSVWMAERQTQAGIITAYWSAISMGHLAGKATGTLPHPDKKNDRGRALRVSGPAPELHPDRDLVIPSRFTEIVILGDGDSDRFTTDMAVRRAEARFQAEGRKVGVAWAPEGKDFNDVLMAA